MSMRGELSNKLKNAKISKIDEENKCKEKICNNNRDKIMEIVEKFKNDIIKLENEDIVSQIIDKDLDIPYNIYIDELMKLPELTDIIISYGGQIYEEEGIRLHLNITVE